MASTSLLRILHLVATSAQRDLLTKNPLALTSDLHAKTCKCEHEYSIPIVSAFFHDRPVSSRVAWVQGQLSMQTAVLSPESMTVLMVVNMEQRHSQLESMFQDKSSNGPEHWQQVAVGYTVPCCKLRLLRSQQRQVGISIYERKLACLAITF